jgi:ABC-type nitrate/sulfonate/bicarbonate transport system substrate-binding protein
MFSVPPLSRLVLLLLRHTREGHPWPSLVRLERTPRRHRRSVVRVLRALEEGWALAARPRDIAADKAGAP